MRPRAPRRGWRRASEKSRGLLRAPSLRCPRCLSLDRRAPKEFALALLHRAPANPGNRLALCAIAWKRRLLFYFAALLLRGRAQKVLAGMEHRDCSRCWTALARPHPPPRCFSPPERFRQRRLAGRHACQVRDIHSRVVGLRCALPAFCLAQTRALRALAAARVPTGCIPDTLSRPRQTRRASDATPPCDSTQRPPVAWELVGRGGHMHTGLRSERSANFPAVAEVPRDE